MKTVLFKRPGLRAEEKSISTEHDRLKAEIGCEYQTTRFQPYENIYLLSAHRETAIGLELARNLWRPPDGVLYGNVIAIRKNEENGRYESLLPADITRLGHYFSEHSYPDFSGLDFPAGEVLSDRDARKAYHDKYAFLALDDLNVVLRQHAQLEVDLWEILTGAVANPKALADIKPRLTYDQVVSLLVALGVIREPLADLLKRLGSIRNKFAHDPAYMLNAQEAERLREDAFGLGDNDSSVPLIQQYCYEQGLELTEESAVLRALYFEISSWLYQETSTPTA